MQHKTSSGHVSRAMSIDSKTKKNYLQFHSYKLEILIRKYKRENVITTNPTSSYQWWNKAPEGREFAWINLCHIDIELNIIVMTSAIRHNELNKFSTIVRYLLLSDPLGDLGKNGELGDCGLDGVRSPFGYIIWLFQGAKSKLCSSFGDSMFIIEVFALLCILW